MQGSTLLKVLVIGYGLSYLKAEIALSQKAKQEWKCNWLYSARVAPGKSLMRKCCKMLLLSLLPLFTQLQLTELSVYLW